MARVKLKDVVMRVKDKVNKDNTDLEFYVGGEHIDGSEICVTKRGIIQGSTIGPAFHMAFKAGDVLLMSRNPHLRKASMVDFDGICSDVSYVCRTKDEGVLLQGYLPFLLQSDDFWRFAEENKKGGLPFFLNWSDFERYEFELPSIEKQRELSDLLWAMQRTKQAYQELLAKTDELVKSQFIEMFGDPNKLPQEALTTIGALTTVVTGATPSRKRSDYYNGTIPWVKTGEIEQGIINDAEEHITDLAVAETNCKILPINTIMLAMYGVGKTRGQSGILKIEAATNQACAAILPNETYDPHFLLYFLRNQYEEIRRLGQGTQQTNLNLSIVRGIPVPKASIAKQREYSAFVEQSDKSKFTFQIAIYRDVRFAGE